MSDHPLGRQRLGTMEELRRLAEETQPDLGKPAHPGHGGIVVRVRIVTARPRYRCYARDGMEAAVWTAIGLLAATSLGSLFYLGTRIDALGARMDARFDALEGRFESRFDAMEGRLESRSTRIDARFDAVDARLDALGARIDTHLDHHTG